MRRTISSALTYAVKVVFPVVWIGIFAVATLLLFSSAGGATRAGGDSPPSEMKWAFLLVTLVGSAFVCWSCVRLKRVELDDAALYISNYQKVIVVPLRDIQDVTENRWINSHPVTIHFHRDTDFGASIVFMPTVRWFAFFSSHPIVAELRTAAARARGAAPDAPAT